MRLMELNTRNILKLDPTHPFIHPSRPRPHKRLNSISAPLTSQKVSLRATPKIASRKFRTRLLPKFNINKFIPRSSNSSHTKNTLEYGIIPRCSQDSHICCSGRDGWGEGALLRDGKVDCGCWDGGVGYEGC